LCGKVRILINLYVTSKIFLPLTDIWCHFSSYRDYLPGCVTVSTTQFYIQLHCTRLIYLSVSHNKCRINKSKVDMNFNISKSRSTSSEREEYVFWFVTPCSLERALLAACYLPASCLAYCSTLKMAYICSSETSSVFRTACPYGPEDLFIVTVMRTSNSRDQFCD
jgi:hypothetical protein